MQQSFVWNILFERKNLAASEIVRQAELIKMETWKSGFGQS